MRNAFFVMGGGIVVAAYWRPDFAMTHARCITGCTVSTLDLDQLQPELRALVTSQILNELPDEIRVDLMSEGEWNNEEITPEIQMSVEEFDDVISNGVPKRVPHEISPEPSISIEVEDDKKPR